MPSKITQADLCENLTALIATDWHTSAIDGVEQFEQRIHDQGTWVWLRQLLDEALESDQLCSEPWLPVYVRVLRCCSDAKTILEIGQASDNALVRLECVWAWARFGRFDLAKVTLEEIFLSLSGTALGFAHQLRASILFEYGLNRDSADRDSTDRDSTDRDSTDRDSTDRDSTDRDSTDRDSTDRDSTDRGGADWRNAWTEVRNRLQGRMLGLALLEESRQHTALGDGFQSRQCAFEAAGLLERDVYHLARARHAVGMSYLHENQIVHAMTALTEAERLSRKRQAQDFRARALSGIAALRRAQGDLDLAESQYRKAIRLAQQPEDLIEALWGIGQCLRLRDQPEQALEQFRRALRVEHPSDWIEVYRALTFLTLLRVDEARVSMACVSTAQASTAQTLTAQTLTAQAGRLSFEVSQRLLVARAELARLEGNTDFARQLLRSLPPNCLTLREESRLFRDLFALLETDQTAVVQAIRVLERRVIEVIRLDPLAVRINGQALAIRPTSKGAQLLRALLRSGGACDVDLLLNALWPENLGSERDRKRKQLWQIVRDLRELLGWRDAIVALGGTYSLDPAADWQLLEPRGSGALG
jgi:tetratricopeptide (TPR) repeat protein